MDAEKMINLQHQMRQNQEEIQAYLKDLNGWEADIKQKEKKLSSNDKKEGQVLPPVRNALNQKKKKKKKAAASVPEEKKAKKISGFDFQAWDKFDVDAACAEVDEASSESGSETTDEEWEVQRRLQQASMLKDQGNQLFKAGRYDEAIECYTQAIAADPNSAVLPANRAMALLKQDKFAAAELDCTTSISLDPTYVKAVSRRATARVSLNKLEAAKEDFQTVLILDPANKQATKELAQIEKLVAPPSAPTGVSAPEGVVSAVYKPPSQRSRKPLRRIPIEEIGEDPAESHQKSVQKVKLEQSRTAQDLAQKDAVFFEKVITKTPESEINVTTSMTPTRAKTTGMSDTSLTSGLSAQPNPVSGCNLNTIVPKPGSTARAAVPSTSSIPPVPATSYQFQADYKVLKSRPCDFSEYLKAIPADHLPRLLGQALDSDIFSHVVTALQDYFSDVDPWQLLTHLATTARFSMTTLMMADADRAALRAVFQHVRGLHIHPEGDVTKLEKQYLG